MTDSMGTIADGQIEYYARGKWDEFILGLEIGGKGEVVDSELDRHSILNRARKMKIRVCSVKLRKGGYKIWRTADAAPRKRGQPRIWN